MQAALVLFDVQKARATKQWDLRTLTCRPGHVGGEHESSSQAESMLSLRLLVPHYLPAWCSSGTSAIGIGDVQRRQWRRFRAWEPGRSREVTVGRAVRHDILRRDPAGGPDVPAELS